MSIFDSAKLSLADKEKLMMLKPITGPNQPIFPEPSLKTEPVLLGAGLLGLSHQLIEYTENLVTYKDTSYGRAAAAIHGLILRYATLVIETLEPELETGKCRNTEDFHNKRKSLEIKEGTTQQRVVRTADQILKTSTNIVSPKARDIAELFRELEWLIGYHSYLVYRTIDNIEEKLRKKES
jgi:hypothetical protein